uniref:Putative ribonuclease H-like domain-containing protein n=1 Tax=Tanacetum cinerariifolium TaxID=118510 RepID=A0A699IVJ1_TANCI|nr:putative ribonuclease H-like domain-containing protein [Tanacetum cinerariifolium]
MPPKPDLSFTGLDEFANKPVVENCDAKTRETKPKDVRKNNNSPIIEKWVSDDEEEEVTQPKIEQKQLNLAFLRLRHYEEINGGHVAFRGNPKGGKITSKGTIRTAERRNRTLIEAARTILADSKLPTTFWAEAVNTACYVQNRVLVVKPHKKTPYELFYGRTPALSFMKPFGCPITILNTLDHLGKFDVEENLHIRFSENTPNVVSSGLDWLFDIDALTITMNWESIAADPKSSYVDGFKPSSDDEKKVDEDQSKGSECKEQEKQDHVNSTNNVNAASTNGVNDVGENISIELPFDPDMPALEDIVTFDFSNKDEDDDEMADMNNLETTIKVSPTPTTRIHKDHPLDQVIRDLHSETQTRNMSKNLEKHRTLFIKRYKGDILLLQVYVDDIIFGSTRKELCNAFEKLIHEKFQMSSMGELTLFLGLQVKQKNDGIFISQDKYVGEILKKFGL